MKIRSASRRIRQKQAATLKTHHNKPIVDLYLFQDHDGIVKMARGVTIKDEDIVTDRRPATPEEITKCNAARGRR